MEWSEVVDRRVEVERLRLRLERGREQLALGLGNGGREEGDVRRRLDARPPVSE